MLADQAILDETESTLLDVNLAVSFLALLSRDERVAESTRAVARLHHAAPSHVADALTARLPREGGAA